MLTFLLILSALAGTPSSTQVVLPGVRTGQLSLLYGHSNGLWVAGDSGSFLCMPGPKRGDTYEARHLAKCLLSNPQGGSSAYNWGKFPNSSCNYTLRKTDGILFLDVKHPRGCYGSEGCVYDITSLSLYPHQLPELAGHLQLAWR